MLTGSANFRRSTSTPLMWSASPSSSRPRTTAFHAVDRGSNPLGDANTNASRTACLIRLLRHFVFLQGGASCAAVTPLSVKSQISPEPGNVSRIRTTRLLPVRGFFVLSRSLHPSQPRDNRPSGRLSRRCRHVPMLAGRENYESL